MDVCLADREKNNELYDVIPKDTEKRSLTAKHCNRQHNEQESCSAGYHPKHAIELLSRTFYVKTRFYKEFDAKMRLALAAHLLGCVNAPELEPVFSLEKLDMIRSYSLARIIKYAVQYPKNGLQIFAAVLYEELKRVQKFTEVEILSFVSNLVGYILIELKQCKHEKGQ